MGVCTLANGMMAKKMVLENNIGQMVLFMKENGKMTS